MVPSGDDTSVLRRILRYICWAPSFPSCFHFFGSGGFKERVSLARRAFRFVTATSLPADDPSPPFFGRQMKVVWRHFT